MKKRILTVAMFAMLFASKSFGQQTALFTQYLENQTYANPAFTGSKEMLSATLLSRFQWVGIEGAPFTTTLSLHGPTSYESVGLGLDLMHDRIGPVQRTNVSGNFAYRFKVSNDAKLSLGLKLGADVYSIGLSELDQTGLEPIGSIQSKMMPTFGAGVYYFSPKWFLGASVPRIAMGNLDQIVNVHTGVMHANMIGGFYAKVAPNWKLRPSFQVWYAENSPLALDLNVAGVYKDQFTIGLMHRFFASSGAYVQFRVSERLKIGYGVDIPNQLSRVNNIFGAHEIMLSFDAGKKKAGKNKKGLMSPRYFN